MDGILTKGVTLFVTDDAAANPGTTVKSKYDWTNKVAISSMFSFPTPKGQREAVDVTDLSDDSYHSIPGLRNNGNILTFECYYEGNATGDNYADLKSYFDGASINGYALQFPNNGPVFFFEGIGDMTIQGGGINEALKFNVDVFLQSDIEEGSFN